MHSIHIEHIHYIILYIKYGHATLFSGEYCLLAPIAGTRKKKSETLTGLKSGDQ